MSFGAAQWHRRLIPLTSPERAQAEARRKPPHSHFIFRHCCVEPLGPWTCVDDTSAKHYNRRPHTEPNESRGGMETPSALHGEPAPPRFSQELGVSRPAGGHGDSLSLKGTSVLILFHRVELIYCCEPFGDRTQDGWRHSSGEQGATSEAVTLAHSAPCLTG